MNLNNYKSPLSNDSAIAQPNASVTPAAVVALMAFPNPGIHPNKNCDTVLPIVDPAAEAMAAWATDLDIDLPNTPPI